jgi:DNA-binding NarL/FixJ family response regulator
MQTVFEDDDRVFDSICAGASGYIPKNHLNTRLVDAINELQFGGSPMSPVYCAKRYWANCKNILMKYGHRRQ